MLFGSNILEITAIQLRDHTSLYIPFPSPQRPLTDDSSSGMEENFTVLQSSIV
jgi:hypothetical protein